MTAAPADHRPCPVCAAPCTPLGAVDFNKNCEETRGVCLPPSGRLVPYVMCGSCGFCFAPEFATWSAEDFRREIYNADYPRIDPDSSGARPRASAESLILTFGERGPPGRHLDYGGGSGLLSDLLAAAGWKSASCDPFFDDGADLARLGTFHLITCYEVFEHVADVNRLAGNLAGLLAADGLVLVSTLLSDGELRPGEPVDWWYAAPRNGHISLFSERSLEVLATKYGFGLGRFSPGLHGLWRGTFPPWARHIVAGG